MYDFKPFKNRLIQSEEWLVKEFNSIRSGRATVNLLDGILIESYGSKMPLNQLATISNEDPRTLKIHPFDANVGKDIEKGINDANLGVSVNVSDSGMRVIFPELTSESRELLLKQLKKKLEEVKATIRTERDDVWNDIQKKHKNGEITEDDKFKLKDEMQKHVDELHKRLETLMNNKEVEIKS